MSALDKIQGSPPVMAAKMATAQVVKTLSGKLGHGGTTLPGKVARRIDRRIIERISIGLNKGSMLVSATNGKTTTSGMIAGILERTGYKVVRNREGANLADGVASALIKDANSLGKPRSEFGLFEVDEAAFTEIATQCRPKVVLLMNLFRDQLDRYGELEHIAALWRDSLKEMDSGTLTVINADDPLVAEMGTTRPDKTIFYGIEDPDAGGEVMQHASDSKYCISCGGPFDYTAFFIGHMGHYRCPACSHERPSPTVYAEKIRRNGMEGSSFVLVTPDGRTTVEITLPGLYNVYNALSAAASCVALGIGIDAISEGLAAFSAAFGRVERLTIDGGKAILMLVKNPAGFNEVVRTLQDEGGKKTLMLALNDKIADGRDISWIWDVDLELLAPDVTKAICSGTRAEEMAMRMKYAGVEQEKLITAPDLRQALEAALNRTNEGELLYILPTYTAMLALRQEIHLHFTTDHELKDLVWK